MAKTGVGGVTMAVRLSEVAAKDGDPLLNLAAAYRHGILNHLQVILGWLELGQPQRAAEHIRLVEEGMFAETRLVRGSLPRVAAVLLARRGSAEQYGIEIDFRVPEALRGFTWPAEVPDDLVGGIIDACLVLLDQDDAGRRLEVVLGEGDGGRSLGLRLHEARVSEERLASALADLAGVGTLPAPGCAMLGQLAPSGVSWECYQEGSVGVVRLSWPV